MGLNLTKLLDTDEAKQHAENERDDTTINEGDTNEGDTNESDTNEGEDIDEMMLKFHLQQAKINLKSMDNLEFNLNSHPEIKSIVEDQLKTRYKQIIQQRLHLVEDNGGAASTEEQKSKFTQHSTKMYLIYVNQKIVGYRFSYKGAIRAIKRLQHFIVQSKPLDAVWYEWEISKTQPYTASSLLQVFWNEKRDYPQQQFCLKSLLPSTSNILPSISHARVEDVISLQCIPYLI